MGLNNGYRILSIKTVAISAAVLSTAVMLHLSGPLIVRFASTEIPQVYGSLISWLVPPYLYVVINGIIISIAASSRFQNSTGSDDVEEIIGSGFESAAPVKDQRGEEEEFVVVAAMMAPAVEEEVKIDYVVPVEENKNDEKDEDEEEEEFVISRSSWDPKKRETETVMEMETATENVTEYSYLMEKPLVSARLGRRKSLTASPEAGRALRVAGRPKRNDTLESTWKAITDGRPIPLTRHLKKENGLTRCSRDDDPTIMMMRKSETFDEHGGGGGVHRSLLIRKEPSLGQDDLNRRVEAFINKFNEEMRMQRQESFNNYFQLINR